MHELACPLIRDRRWRETSLVAAGFPQAPCCSPQSKLRGRSGPTHSMSHWALDPGWSQPSRLSPGTQRSLCPQAEPGWAGSSHCCHLLTRCLRSSLGFWRRLLHPHHASRPRTFWGSRRALPALRCVSKQRRGSKVLRLWWAMRDKRDLQPRLCLSRARKQGQVPEGAAHRR